MASHQSSVYIQNAHSKADNWGKRSQTLASRAIASDASFIAFQELYKTQAAQMDKLLASHYVRGTYRAGRVIYYRPDRWKPLGSAAWKNMRNGKSKPAVGRKFERIGSGVRLNVINVHLSYEVNAAGRKKRRSETKNIVAWDAKRFRKDRSLLVGDWNSPAGATNRPDDSGPIMAKWGYHDLGVAAKTKLGRGNYHIDRAFGSRTRMKATKISIDRHGASDHPGVFVKFEFTV